MNGSTTRTQDGRNSQTLTGVSNRTESPRRMLELQFITVIVPRTRAFSLNRGLLRMPKSGRNVNTLNELCSGNRTKLTTIKMSRSRARRDDATLSRLARCGADAGDQRGREVTR